MRSQITKSLQTRCRSIQNAITSLNAAASALDPPRPPLNWSEVGGYHFIEQFALLQNTHQDIRGKRWTEPAIRAIMKKRHRIRRAHEEISRLNVEVRRLHTAIRDERIHFREVRTRLQDTNSPLLGAVKEFTERRQRINDELLVRVHQIYNLAGYTGIVGPGVRLGSIAVAPEVAEEIRDAGVIDDQLADEDVDVLEGDEEQEAFGHIIEFLSALSI